MQAIGPDKSTEKQKNDKQPLQMVPNGSKGEKRSGGERLEDLEPILQRTLGLNLSHSGRRGGMQEKR